VTRRTGLPGLPHTAGFLIAITLPVFFVSGVAGDNTFTDSAPAENTSVEGTRVIEDFRGLKAGGSDARWCWAAALQMVLKSQGVNEPQKAILAREANDDGSAFDVETLVDPLTFDFKKKGAFRIQPRVVPRPLRRAEVFDAFDRDRWILADMGGPNPWSLPPHLVVIYGYRLDLMNQLHLKVFDPWPPRGSYRDVEFHEEWGWQKSVLLTVESADSTDDDQSYKNPVQCMSLATSDVQWGPNLHAGTLYYSLTYENSCRRPVRCQVTVQSGNEMEGFALAGTAAWIIRQSKTAAFVLMPGAVHTIRGGLKWGRMEKGAPNFLYPNPSRGENLHLMRCEFLMKSTD